MPGEAPESEGEPTPSQATERALQLFSALDASVGERGQECAGFTQVLSGWLRIHGDEIRDILVLDLPDASHEQIDEKITEAATTVVFAASACGKSETAMLAYDEFDALVL